MRIDMAKVVTERPRRGHSNKSLKTAKRLSKDEISLDDHGSTKAPVSKRRQHGWDAKEFSDLLGPLKGYLRKQVGRPWNKVYAEMSAILNKRTLSGIHIWNHIKWEVQTNVEMQGKVPFEKTTRYGYGPNQIYGLYVHPTTGILCETPTPKRPKYVRPPKALTEVKLGENEVLKKEDSIWYRYVYSKVKTSVPVWDHKEKRFYAKPIEQLKFKKIQLNKTELKSFNLKNGV